MRTTASSSGSYDEEASLDHLAQVHPRLYDKYLYVGTTRARNLSWGYLRWFPLSLAFSLRPMFVSNWSETLLLGGRWFFKATEDGTTFFSHLEFRL